MTTKTAQFTPGPWRVDGEGMQVYKDKQPIAVIRTVFDENGGRVTREANAALIAAAPAMYEALQLALVMHPHNETFRQAIAQAEGRQA